MDFDMAFERLLGHEGVLSLDPKDRGNWTSGVVNVGELKGTKYGVSAMSYPNEDIANLSKDRAKEIYYRDFWGVVHAEKLYDGVAWQLFDFAVNSGAGTAVRYFQRALNVADDGRWGPVSEAAAQEMSESDQIMRINAERLDFMTRTQAWKDNSRGFARRIANNLRYGAVDS